MKFEELKQNLKSEIRPCYLLYGADTFLVYKSLDLIKSAASTNSTDLNVTVFNEDDKFSFSEVLNSLNSVSFFDDKRVVVLKNYAAKMNKGEEESLNDFLLKEDLGSILVFFYTTECENLKKLLLNKKITFIDCNYLSNNTLVKIVTKSFENLGKKISFDVSSKLISLCGSDLFKIYNEISKISSYALEKTEIEMNDVTSFIEETLEYEIYELTDALTKKNNSKALEIYNKFVAEKRTQGLFNLLYNHFCRMFYCAISTNDDICSLAVKLNVKAYAIKKAIEHSKSYTKKQLKEILFLISEAEYNFKSGKLKEETAFKNLLLKIM